MYYRLVRPWALAGYRGDQFVLEKQGSQELPYRLTFPLFALLSKCDGQTDMGSVNETEADILNRYIKRGVLEAVECPAPIDESQMYRYYDNRRVPQGFFSITGRCNMACRHCFSATEAGDTKPFEFTLDQVKYILDQFCECNIRTLTISGGEPLLRKDFSDIIRYMHEKGMNIYRLFTNGLKFDQGVCDLLREYDLDPEIVISFDGLGIHDWMRNMEGAQEDAIRAIRLAAENGFKVRSAINVNSKTAKSLPESCRFLYDQGVRSIFFVRTSEGPKWISSGYGSMTAPEYWDSMIEVVEALREQNKKDLQLQWFNGPTISAGESADDFLAGDGYKYESHDIKNSGWCHKAIYQAYVSSTGRLLPCDGFEGAALQTGFLANDSNILNRPLRDILNDSEYATAMRTSAEDIISANPECQECEWVGRCKGSSCRACGNLYAAVANGFTFNHFKLSVTLRGPLTCSYYRDGYHDRLVNILKET